MSKTRKKNQGTVRGKQKVRLEQQLLAQERVKLEKSFYYKIKPAAEFSRLAVNLENGNLPLHRWLAYRQGFSPLLVREFLNLGELASGPVLDPFSGSGTTVIEAMLQTRKAIGVEAISSLVFLTALRINPQTGTVKLQLEKNCSLEKKYNSCTDPQEKAVLLLAATRTLKGDGSPLRNPPPLPQLVADCVNIINADTPVKKPGKAVVLQGDARSLPLNSECIGGILTSPPYLSRYSYPSQQAKIEKLFRSSATLNCLEKNHGKRHQVAACLRSNAKTGKPLKQPAIREIITQLKQEGKNKQANVVNSYFQDMFLFLQEAYRVLQPSAPLLLVIAGARLKDVYVPADLIILDYALQLGFCLEEILKLRTFGSAKLLGSLGHISPREVIISLRK